MRSVSDHVPSRLGPYEVVSRIGSGGMGEIFLARDPRLGREIAVKVLPRDLLSSPETVARFAQEARAASALNHPNIVTIHDVELDGTPPFIAMELVDGKTLRAEMRGGPMSPAAVLRIAAQLAAGLEAAHSAGIFHRDLKPENVMVTRDGRVKILDFGLAKQVPGRPAAGEASPQRGEGRDETGLAGTADYMSPEQVKGLPVDFRSDQFSLGAILYEMLTGLRPFTGETAVDTLSAIVRDDPVPVERLAKATPLPLAWIVERCLARDPADRYASTRDLARDLATLRDRWPARGEARTGLDETPPAVPAVRRGGSFVATVATAAATVLGAAALLAGAFLAGGRLLAPSLPRFRALTFEQGVVRGARFQPDGRSVLYAAAWEGAPFRIFLRRFGEPEALAIEVPGANRLLGISPAGEMALLLNGRATSPFVFAGTLARLESSATGPREVQQGVSCADWSPDGSSLATVHDESGLSVLEFPVGRRLHETQGFLSSVRVSRDGRRVAFVEHPAREFTRGDVHVIGADGTGLKQLAGPVELGGLAWSPSGEEVWFGRQRSFVAVDLSGRQRTLLELPEEVTVHDVSADGRLLVAHDKSRMEIHGRTPRLDAEQAWSWLEWSTPVALSRDGRSLLFNEYGEGVKEGGAVCLRGTDGKAPIRLGSGSAAALSPDGRWVLTFEGSDKPRIVLVPTGAGSSLELPAGPIRTVHSGAFTPDGKRIVLAGSAEGTPVRLYLVDPSSDEGPRLLSRRDVHLGALAVSPDGSLVSATGPERRPWLFPVDGSEPRPIPGLGVGDVVYGFTPDGREVWTASLTSVPQPLVRLDLATGRKETVRTLMPRDPSGVSLIGPVCLTPDGSTYAYGSLRTLSELFLVTPGSGL